MKPRFSGTLATVAVLAFALVSVTFYSCEKEVVTPDDKGNDSVPNTVITPSVFAGIWDSSFHYQQFPSPLTLNYVYDSTNIRGTGSIELDLDNDGMEDVRLTASKINPDSFTVITQPWLYAQGYWLVPLREMFFASVTESYPIGMGQTQQATFVDTLGYGAPIDTLSDWIGSFESPQVLWSVNYSTFAPSNGPWAYANPSGFVGIKILNKEGWIELDASDPANIKIVSTAIQQ